MVTEAIMAPLYAPIGDRFGRRPVVLILTACWGFFAMGFGTAQSVLVAVALRGARESPTITTRA
jgi:MFS family permease